MGTGLTCYSLTAPLFSGLLTFTVLSGTMSVNPKNQQQIGKAEGSGKIVGTDAHPHKEHVTFEFP